MMCSSERRSAIRIRGDILDQHIAAAVQTGSASPYACAGDGVGGNLVIADNSAEASTENIIKLPGLDDIKSRAIC